MKNPGFVVYLEKKTKMRFILRCPKGKNQESINNCLCVYKIISGYKFELNLHDENYMSSPWGYYSK